MSDEDNFDVERFIEEIKKRLAIWDPNSKDYRETNARKLQWDEVCALCIPNFDGLSASEKLRLASNVLMYNVQAHL
ncbi:hypothetical protein J437_LFUL003955 [Ladona fulva]|uniref:MADF domain-containing protein n=1 Tax=Ladona fulva TaxID=123851 RepID=A0A8K0NRI7_LADFU|nr:hypothetical protein J437_LFUL003955 [Ladona fulva]